MKLKDRLLESTCLPWTTHTQFTEEKPRERPSEARVTSDITTDLWEKILSLNKTNSVDKTSLEQPHYSRLSENTAFSSLG